MGIVISMNYGKAVLIAFDQLVNAVLCGWPDETLSSRAWRLDQAGKSWPKKFMDTLFFWDKAGAKRHCQLAFESEREGRQLPPEIRK